MAGLRSVGEGSYDTGQAGTPGADPPGLAVRTHSGFYPQRNGEPLRDLKERRDVRGL